MKEAACNRRRVVVLVRAAAASHALCVSSVMLWGSSVARRSRAPTCVLVVSWITAFLKFSLESVLPMAPVPFGTDDNNRATAAEDP